MPSSLSVIVAAAAVVVVVVVACALPGADATRVRDARRSVASIHDARAHIVADAAHSSASSAAAAASSSSTPSFVIRAPVPHVPPRAPGLTLGDANAPLTMTWYFDLQCPYCKLAWPTLKRVVEKYTADGSLFFRARIYPLWLHDQAYTLAQSLVVVQNATRRAGAPERVWDYVDYVFANQAQVYNAQWTNRTRLELYTLLARWASPFGVGDTAQFFAALDSDAVGHAVGVSIDAGLADTVFGTPTFYINGVRTLSLGDHSTFEQWCAAIDGLLDGKPVPEVDEALDDHDPTLDDELLLR